jgi:hypothetical protein
MAEDKDPPAPPSSEPESTVHGQSDGREARLAAALRANLKRRKAAERQGPLKR